MKVLAALISCSVFAAGPSKPAPTVIGFFDKHLKKAKD